MRRALSAFLAAVLVLSTVAVGATGTAAAATDRGIECEHEFGIPFTERVLTFGKCTYQEPSIDGQTSASFTADTAVQRVENAHTTLPNDIEADRTMALRKFEAGFARAMANESTKAKAKTAGVEAATEYLEKRIRNNIVLQNNAFVADITKIQGTSGASVYPPGYGSDQATGNISSYEATIWNGKANYTFHAAEKSGEDAMLFRRNGIGTSYATFNTTGFTHYDGSHSGLTAHFSDSQVNDKSLNTPSLADEFKSYIDIRGMVITEADNFASNVSESEYDNLSAGDIPSPITQATEFGQSYNDTNSTGYASALAAMVGAGDVSVGTSYHVEMHDNDMHYNGTIFGDAADFPNGTIEVNRTYDGTNQTAWIIPESGDGNKVRFDSNYTVHGINLNDGTAVNSTELSQYDTATLNGSAPLDALYSWANLSDRVDTGGSGGVPLGNNMMLLLGGGLVLLAGYIYTQDDDGNGGGTTVIGMGGGDGKDGK